VKFNAGKAAANFSLAPRKRVKKFVFVQVADTHHFKTTHSPHDIASFIKAAHGLKPAPEFVIATGDLPMGVDGVEKSGFHRLDKCLAMYDGFVDVFKPLKQPLLKVIGNHDCAICLPKRLPEHHKGLYRRYFGPLNYSFDYGDIHFVALDANIDAGPIIKPGRWRDGTYDVFSRTALSWIKKDLSFQPKGKPIVLFTHQPPWGQKNFDRLVEILKPHNFKAAFAGHIFPAEALVCGDPLFVPYAPPGQPLAWAVREGLLAYNDQYGQSPRVILLQNHGMVALAPTPQAVLDITAMMVKAARTLLGTFALGGPRFIKVDEE